MTDQRKGSFCHHGPEDRCTNCADPCPICGMQPPYHHQVPHKVDERIKALEDQVKMLIDAEKVRGK